MCCTNTVTSTWNGFTLLLLLFFLFFSIGLYVLTPFPRSFSAPIPNPTSLHWHKGQPNFKEVEKYF